eukprot:Phypoly_transcript_11573.p1 GENE.Phypoly_transcript_11573~~Phypoly_transcript_11573.p1  ORF type:complete len:389 (+),score=56.53 Phypoly_transcript_11573:25-1167(+)
MNVHTLCTNGDVEKLREFLESQKALIDLEQIDADFYTPLKLACKNGHLKIAELLLSKGATAKNETNAMEYEEVKVCTPLYYAARGGHAGIVKLLLQNGAEIDEQCVRGETALYIAAKKGHLEVVIMLVENGALLEVESHYNGTAVMGASWAGKADVIKYLLEHGANPFSQGDGGTSLCLAAREGHTRVVQLLLEYGAGVDDTSYIGINALCAAVVNNYADMVKLLIKHGACVDRAASFNIGLTLRLGLKGSKGEDIKLWIFMSPFHYAIKNRYLDTIWILGLAGISSSTLYQEKGQKALSVWELCAGDASTHSALLHFWSPQDHFRHPKCTRKAIISVLLIAKRLQWPFDKGILFKIFQHVAYGWWPKSAKRAKLPKTSA